MPARGSATQRSGLFARQQPGGFWDVSHIEKCPNNIWFVGSAATLASDAAGYGRNPDRPFATLDYAVSYSDVETGDTIYLLPGHAENLAADSAVDVDVSNLQIIGLGWGGCRPTFTCTVAAGDFKLAASCGILRNILFINAVDQSTGLLEISSSDWTLSEIEIRESDSSAAQANVYIVTTADADRLRIQKSHDSGFGLRINQGGTDAGPVTAIDFVGADDLVLKDFQIYGNFSTGAVQFVTTASARISVSDGYIWTQNAADICIVDTTTTSTGKIGPNLCLMLQDNAANVTEAVTAAACHMMQPINIVNLAGESSMQTNITATTD